MRLRQRVGAFLFYGILGGEHQKRLARLVTFALDGDLLFLHHFQQRRLGLCRGAVDFIGQQKVAEDRAAPHQPLLRFDVIQGMAGDIAGHEVRGKLYPAEAALYGARDGLDQQGLAQPRHALDQRMSGRDKADQRLLNNPALADHGISNLRLEPLDVLMGRWQCFRCHSFSAEIEGCGEADKFGFRLPGAE